ncbi:MAG TPA: MFS transporter [Arachidicoccus sp.]
MQSNGISKPQIAVLSIAAGICVANIYYNQPILSAIQKDLNLQETQVGNLPVLSQAGYGLGLLLLTPLGDKIERKKLIIVMQLLLIVALCGLTFTHSLTGLYVLSFLVGCLATATQVILPMAAAMATKDKGKIVGIVFTGVLIGILGARIFSGYIADWLSWRYVFGISACMVALTSIMVGVTLPSIAPTYKGHYGALLSSTLIQLKRFPLLRRISLLGVFTFGTFCSFWTTLTFHLSGAPFNYKSDMIGLFGVLAIGGALVAPLFGKLADKSNPAKNQLLSVGIIIISVALIQLFPYSLAAFVITTFLMDVGVQATQVTNIAQVYTLDESAHSRINTMYMTLMFIGGAFGTWVGVKCWTIGGWNLVGWQLLLWACIAMAIAFAGYKKSVKK